MSNRAPARITIGGKFTPRLIDELVGLLKIEGLCLEWDTNLNPEWQVKPTPNEVRESVTRQGYITVWDEDAPHAYFPEIEDWCVDNGLPFHRWSGALPEIGETITLFDPEHSSDPEAVPSDDGEPALALKSLTWARNHGKTLDDVVKDLQRYQVEALLEAELVEDLEEIL